MVVTILTFEVSLVEEPQILFHVCPVSEFFHVVLSVSREVAL